MANTATTLSRAAFCPGKEGLTVLKLGVTTGYTVGGATTVGTTTGIVTQLLNSNTVRYMVLTNSLPSGNLLFPKGTAVS